MVFDISDWLEGIIHWFLKYYPFTMSALFFPFVMSLIYLLLEKHFGWVRCHRYQDFSTNKLRSVFVLSWIISLSTSVIMYVIILTYIEGYWRW